MVLHLNEVATYELVASEYYEADRHPTCANFREASRILLEQWVVPRMLTGLMCDVGCGRSVLAEYLYRVAPNVLSKLTLVDASPTMIAYSESFNRFGARLHVSSADDMPFATGTVQLLFSSLGDPYNTPAFWTEVKRVLHPNGEVFFTTPSWEWTEAFRGGLGTPNTAEAEFELKDGRRAFVPSIVLPEEDQCSLMVANGLKISRILRVTRSELSTQHISPKLLVQDPTLPVVTAFAASRV